MKQISAHELACYVAKGDPTSVPDGNCLFRPEDDGRAFAIVPSRCVRVEAGDSCGPPDIWPKNLQALLNKARQVMAAAIFLLLAATIAGLADTPILNAPDAVRKLEAGELVILDIRTPQEWAETGVAEGAWPVSMHSPDFSQQLQSILSQFPTDEIALICATGGRTSYVAEILEKNGVTGVLDISEGMFGNGSAPGWIARDLPIVPLEEAKSNYEQARQAWK